MILRFKSNTHRYAIDDSITGDKIAVGDIVVHKQSLRDADVELWVGEAKNITSIGGKDLVEVRRLTKDGCIIPIFYAHSHNLWKVIDRTPLGTTATPDSYAPHLVSGISKAENSGYNCNKCYKYIKLFTRCQNCGALLSKGGD